MGALAEAAQFARRGAARPGAGVEAAFEGADARAAGVGAREGEVRRVRGAIRQRVGVDLGGGRGGVLGDRPRRLEAVAGGVAEAEPAGVDALTSKSCGVHLGESGVAPRRRRRQSMTVPESQSALADAAGREPPVSVPEQAEVRASPPLAAAPRERVDRSPWRSGVDAPSKEAGLCSALPAWSTARTSKVWEPSPRPLSSRGEEQVAQAPGWLESRRHSKAPTPEPPVSVPEKVKLAAALLVSAAGWVSICVVRRGGVDAPCEGGGALVGVPRLVDRADFESVGAVAEAAQFARRGAARPGAGLVGVEAAFEGAEARAAGVGAREGEVGGGGVGERRRVGVDLGDRGGGVDVQSKEAGL